MTLRGRRIYEDPSSSDGQRVLVDRLWPRGLAKDAAHIDVWPKSLTPSTELRKWYHAGSGSFEEFSQRYEAELAEPEAAAALGELRKLAAAGPVTLLTASKDIDRSHVAVLLRVLGSK
ncbi:DUF488 family protein [Streptomyces sp. YC504]|uniref:DUF488 family protein n=1 Tax=Streptomyces mesophilus TaxID=1775132 RepID=A0A6G4XQ10_9ACTN|nr:DUF488 family protein [Streptomyces mesophilus]NGO79282.1 DUF488 family protein [Streptomyces mesophilus]